MSNKQSILIWLNVLIAIGMSSCVFTGQLKIELEVFGYPLIFPASNIFFALLTFPITDIITEIFGKKQAQQTVIIGFSSQIITIAIVHISILFPGQTQTLMPFAIGGINVLIGSAVAYFIAQYWDIIVFDYIKHKWTGEKHLWLRNNISTFSSQIINSCLFISIVFGPELLLIMLPGTIIVKTILALFDTPFVYFACLYLKNKNFDSTSDKNFAIQT